MKIIKFEIDNLKCGGCENTIKTRLIKFEGVEKVKINLEESSVIVECSDGNDKKNFISALAKLGYPEKGTTNKFQTAKSYVSCAVGKVSDKLTG